MFMANLTKEQKKRTKKLLTKLYKMDDLSNDKELSDISIDDIRKIRKTTNKLFDLFEEAINGGCFEELIEYGQKQIDKLEGRRGES